MRSFLHLKMGENENILFEKASELKNSEVLNNNITEPW